MHILDARIREMFVKEAYIAEVYTSHSFWFMFQVPIYNINWVCGEEFLTVH